MSPLAAAARAGDLAAVRRLLAEGYAAAGDPHDPLWQACAGQASEAARIAIAEALLAAGANPRRDVAGETALHAAARRGPLALVDLLIRHDALEWQPDREGRSPPDAARSGDAADKAAIVALLRRPVIDDPSFRAAVAALQQGDAEALGRRIDSEPRLLRERILEPECYRAASRHQYFRDPKLFWFIANNPTLMPRIPATMPAVAQAMIDRGVDQDDLDYALELVMTNGDPDGIQTPLMAVLLAAGARATPRAVAVTLAHRQLVPIQALLRAGQPMTASIAAAFGDLPALRRLLADAPAEATDEALGMAVINGRLEAARAALDAGADPNAFLPVHCHSTALHQAALDEDLELIRLLVARGARTDLRDRMWDGTALGWARHEGKTRSALLLESLGG